MIRFIFAWFLNDGKTTRWDDVIGGNFKDDQYHYWVHLAAFLLTAALVVVLGRFYESTATVAVLAFAYMSILLSLAQRFFKPLLIHADKSRK